MYFRRDWSRSPHGVEIQADSLSLKVGGKRVLWAMGEFHYARCPESQWRDELLKMKAGGIDVVSTYVFWIHHEEIEGKWNWSGRRSLRHFLSLCKEIGLMVFLRGGPWVHGECRNGGFPDWLVKGYKTRTTDPAYLSKVSELYRQISAQMSGLSWKDGGPVIGFQLENEYGGSPEYLLKLKEIAIGAGIHVLMFTRTGWPNLRGPLPSPDILPLYGGYPVGFWDRGIAETADRYGSGYLMTLLRNPDRILQDKPSVHASVIVGPDDPYLCCEIGGGMAVSYHRRIDIAPDDIGSLALVKLASGNNLQGYYMFHGGANPEGALTTLNETQATGYWNDLPVKTYDFQAPIGEAGQLRDHYHILRRMHLFMKDFGSGLAGMSAALPDAVPSNSEDIGTLRWSVRSDGTSGFLFVNNYQRLKQMPVKASKQFKLNLSAGSLVVPATPIDVPANGYFFWPFNLKLGKVVLRYATAQPICTAHTDGQSSYFFAQTVGVPSEFAFDHPGVEVLAAHGKVQMSGDHTLVSVAPAGLSPAIVLKGADGKIVNVFLLTREQSLALWKGSVAGRDRVVITDGGVIFDRDNLVVCGDAGDGTVAVYPPLTELHANGRTISGDLVGAFSVFVGVGAARESFQVTAVLTEVAGAPRAVRMGSQGVAEQPSDSDFCRAQVWTLHLPRGAALARQPVLSVHYLGDVARVYLNGKLISDNFYNGKAHEIDLAQFGPKVFRGKLELLVLPLRADAPIYLAPSAKPVFDSSGAVCKIIDVKVYAEVPIRLSPAIPQ